MAGERRRTPGSGRPQICAESLLCPGPFLGRSGRHRLVREDEHVAELVKAAPHVAILARASIRSGVELVVLKCSILPALVSLRRWPASAEERQGAAGLRSVPSRSSAPVHSSDVPVATGSCVRMSTSRSWSRLLLTWQFWLVPVSEAASSWSCSSAPYCPLWSRCGDGRRAQKNARERQASDLCRVAPLPRSIPRTFRSPPARA